MTKVPKDCVKHRICVNCTHAKDALIGRDELILCTNVSSEHCGHVLAWDHVDCGELELIDRSKDET